MKIHFFQHVPFEGLGVFEDWASMPGNGLTGTKFFEDEKLPFVDICDLLIVMGGPMGVNDTNEYPWLKKEKEFIEKALKRGKKVLGVCLGAQLLAEVLGAKVYKNKEKEIGWHDIDMVEGGRELGIIKDFGTTEKVFHWHGDTFDLPDGATHLFKSEACENQSFIYNNQALALQFHIELTETGIVNLIENCGHELSEKGQYIQKAETLVNQDFIRKSNRLANNLLINFVNV